MRGTAATGELLSRSTRASTHHNSCFGAVDAVDVVGFQIAARPASAVLFFRLKHAENVRWEEHRLHLLRPLARGLLLARVELNPPQLAARLIRVVVRTGEPERALSGFSFRSMSYHSPKSAFQQ